MSKIMDDVHLEILMERIRYHAPSLKPFSVLAKAMRSYFVDRRYILDAVEKTALNNSLDIMHHKVMVTSRQGLVDRLESLSKKLGLKFMDDSRVLFISTDMFYLEIILDERGLLEDVKVHHESKVEQQSCKELLQCLRRGNFADFMAQLEGLSSIYQLNAEPKVKTKAFDAMQAMEFDLYQIFKGDICANSDILSILSAPGRVIPLKRRGGHPMRLLFFISPKDHIKEGKPRTITLKTLKDRNVGYSFSVYLEASSANKLAIKPTVKMTKDSETGINKPIFAPLTQLNSMLLPANFVLKLNTPLPVCYKLWKSFLATSKASTDENISCNVDHTTNSNIDHIVAMIVKATSDQLTKRRKHSFYIPLLDQSHHYYICGNNELKAILINSIPYTKPGQVHRFIDFFKRHAILYTLISSCIRAQPKGIQADMESRHIIEVNITSYQEIIASFLHPYIDIMISLEFHISACGNITCKLFYGRSYEKYSSTLTQIAQKFLSIPLTVRALIKHLHHCHMMRPQQEDLSDNHGVSANTSCGNNIKNPNNITSNDNGTDIPIPSVDRKNIISPTSALGNYLMYKDPKKEDFSEPPMCKTAKTESTLIISQQSFEPNISSFGHVNHQEDHTAEQHQQQSELQQKLTTGIIKSSEGDIADKYKNIWKSKTFSMKNSVSITPISEQTEASGTNSTPLDVQRTGGIEIIPLSGPNTTNANTAIINTATSISSSSTITITAINVASSVTNKDKKTSSTAPCLSSGGGPFRLSVETGDSLKDKKRKRKKDDSPMGPPEKVFPRQNSPANCGESTLNITRKFSSPSSSPNAGILLVSNAVCVGSAIPTTRQSSKDSPVYSSPKHSNASNSPKSPFGTNSPKHGSSGKPSMSTLKNATVVNPKVDKLPTSAPTPTPVSASTMTPMALVRPLGSSTNPNIVTSNSAVSAVSGATVATGPMSILKIKEKPTLNVSTTITSTTATVKTSVSPLQMKNVIASSNIAAAATIGFSNLNQRSASLELTTALRKGVINTYKDTDNKYDSLAMNAASVSESHQATNTPPVVWEQ